MMKVRKIGFRNIYATRDTVDLHRQSADQLKQLGESPDASLRFSVEVDAERFEVAH
jgi:hypothetical protein